MPQVVKTQPTGAYTTGGQSIGAVIFDKPQYDPATIALKVSDDLDNLAKEKAIEAAKQKAESAKLVADLNFDSKGAFPDDTDYFKQGAEKLKQQVTDLYGYPTNSAEYNKKLQEAELAKSWMQSDVNESAKQWEQYKDSWAKFNPEKHDQQKFNEWNAKVRLARTPAERRDLFKESPLVDKVGDFQTLLGERMSKGLYKPTVTETAVTEPVSGRVGTKKVEQYTDDDIARNASAIVNGDSDMSESAVKGLDDLKNRSKLLYDQVVSDAKTAGIDPLEMFVRKQLKNSNNIKMGFENLAWNPAYTASVQHAYANKDVNDAVNFVVEQAGNLLNGKPESYSIGGEKTEKIIGQTPMTPVVEGKLSVPISDQFQGWKIGKYTVDEPQYANGQPVLNADGSQVTKKVAKDNTVLSWKWDNGTPYIKTEETLYNAGGYVAGNKVDAEGWKPANQTDVERLIISNVAPGQQTKAIEAYREKLTKEKAYKERTARPQEMVGQTKKTIKKQEISAQDKTALDWLQKNPNAPQADAIRKTLKAKGLIK